MTGHLNGRAPANVEAEEAVLGTCLLKGSVPGAVRESGIRPEHFYRESHEIVFRAMLEMSGEINEITLAAKLSDLGLLDEIGGRAAIARLTGPVDGLSAIKEHARLVVDAAYRRARVEAGYRVLEAHGDADVWRREAERVDRETLDRGSHADRRYDFADLIEIAGEELPYRVEPVAVNGHLTVIAAAGGEGKTMLQMAFAGGVAQGTSIAGMPCTPGRAVIFDAENGPWVLGNRLRALHPELPADKVSIYDAQGLNLARAEDRAWFRDVIRQEQANPGGGVLVGIDSLRALTPDMPENDSDAVAPVIIGLKEIARETGAAVILLHHRGHDSSRPFHGSTVIRDQADAVFVLERDDKDPERKWRRRLRNDKFRPGPEPADRWIGIRGWRGQITLTEAEPFDPDPMRANRPATVRDDIADQALAAVIDDGPITRTGVANALGRNKSDGTVRRALKQLEEDGRIRRTDDGTWVATTEDGHPPRDNNAIPLHDAETGVATAPMATVATNETANRGQSTPTPPFRGAGADGHPATPLTANAIYGIEEGDK